MTKPAQLEMIYDEKAEALAAADALKPCIIDLFAGVGGLSLGALRAGFRLALAVELDAHAMAAHEQNFPGFKHLREDISYLDGDKLLKHAGLDQGDLDGLIGGPPCQGFSVMGQRSVVDPRNNLFVKFFAVTKEVRPKFFVAENVLGILHEQYDAIRENAFREVEDDYVLLDPIRLKASEYGVPTVRERVFFIGYRADAVGALTRADFESKRVACPTRVEEALRGLPARVRRDWLTEEKSWRLVQEQPDSPFWQHVTGEIPRGVGDAEALQRYRDHRLVSGCFGTRHSPEVKARYRRLKHGEKDSTSKAVRLNPEGFCPTLRAGTDAERGSYQAVRPIHPTSPRVITPREAARLQGFPDWFRFAPSKWHSFRQIGNSVSPIVAEVVFRTIYSHIEAPAKT